MTRRAGWTMGLAAIAVVSLCLAAPTLLEVSPAIGMVRPRTYPLLNPMRSREPEREAEKYLQLLKSGERGFLASAVSPDVREHIVRREAQWPVVSWRIGRRIDGDASVSLMYWVRRGGGYWEGEEEVYFDIAKSTPPRVLSFGAIY